MKLERFSFLTAFVRRRSEAVLPPWRRSFQQSRQLRSRLSPFGTFGSKEAFICGSGKPFTHVVFLGGCCLRFSQENSLNSPYLLVTGAHAVIPHALDNLSMGKGEKEWQDLLLGCYHIENSYHRSCWRTDRCVNTMAF